MSGRRYEYGFRNRPDLEKRHWENMRQNYKLTREVYEAVIESQHNCCAICGLPFTWDHPPQVDHDHLWGNVREFLCPRCNQVLGMIQDDPKLLMEMKAYLHKHRHKRRMLMVTP
jgi:hypothetical protein